MNMTPIAQSVQSQGRGGDSMLVHMTPGEVGGLQALALANGGSLTINPTTGLPEAGFLRNILPMVAGAALASFGIPPHLAGIAVGGVGALATGDLSKGLMMGLGAAGGAGMAGSAANLAAPAAVPEAVTTAATDLTNQAVTSSFPGAAVGDTVGNIYTSSGSAQDALLARGAETLPASVQSLPAPTLGAPAAPVYQAQIGTAGGPQQLLSPGTTLGAPVPGATGPGPVMEGFQKAFSSADEAGKFLGSNKMNLAMSAAPFLIPEDVSAPEGRKFQHREYDLDIQNTSGQTPVDPYGREQKTMSYEFTPTTVGGAPVAEDEKRKIRYADGGTTSSAGSSGFGGVNPDAGIAALPISGTGLTVPAGYAPQLYAPFASVDTSRFADYDVGTGMGMRKVGELQDMGATPAEMRAVAMRAPIVGPRAQQALFSYADAPSNEQMVMSDIASIQRMAGLPAIAPTLPRETRYRYDLTQPGNLPPPLPSVPYTPFSITDALNRYDKSVTDKSTAKLFKGIKGSQKDGIDTFEVDGITYKRVPEDTSSFQAQNGGSVPMLEEGGFVLTKKAVDGLGKGDNKKGQKVASRGLGAIPIKGPGTGRSDSIKTSINGKHPARVSNGESYVPKKEVERRGGAKKFYALMKRAERRA